VTSSVQATGKPAARRGPVRPTALAARVAEAAVWLFALLVVALFRIIDSTINLHIVGYEHVSAIVRSGRPVLVVVWHGRGCCRSSSSRGCRCLSTPATRGTGRFVASPAPCAG